jgi:hypothetical protein
MCMFHLVGVYVYSCQFWHCSSIPMGHSTAAAIPSRASEQQGEDKASGAGQEFV